MPRPKGSLNKKRPEPKPELKVYEKMETIRDLREMAKDRGIKLRGNIRYTEIRELLGMEPKEHPKRYDHCKERKPAQAMVKTNVETGEETRYRSIYELANDLGVFAGSVTYHVKKGKQLVRDGVSYTRRRE